MRRMSNSQYRSPSGHRSSYYDIGGDTSRSSSRIFSANTTPTASQFDLSRSYDETGCSPSRFQRRRSSYISSSFIPNVSLYDKSEPMISEDYANEGVNTAEAATNYSTGGVMDGICSECGEYRYLVQCLSHCNIILCESCQNGHWIGEINELMQIKLQLEDSVANMRKYLNSKKQQCNENIKSCQQIKKFIAMTMQQIKRKIELELENKRDELYDTIDSFVDNQKRLSQSINEEGFQASERICQEIDNMLLTTGDEMNFFKVKTVKGLASLQYEKFEKQNAKKIPFYSIFFIPDSTIQVQNTFGKLIMKSYDEEEFDDDPISSNVPNVNNFEHKPLRNKIIDQVKAEKLQKWNSAESLQNKKLQHNFEVPKKVPFEVYKPNSELSRQSPQASSPEHHNKAYQTTDHNHQRLSPLSTTTQRVKSAPAPSSTTAKLRLKKVDTGIAYSSTSQITTTAADTNGGNSSADDYFSSFRPLKKAEIKVIDAGTDSDDDGEDADIVSI